jgi:SSS family solute:Na+ symporter
MHPVDWLIMVLPLAICASITFYARRYVRSVADFMAGGRNAGRFLICTARSEQGAGAVVYVASFQVFLVAGFTLAWWGNMSVPVGLLVAITGFVIYRYRQTRAFTLGQFFEMRYSRNFRLFAGGLAFFAGLVNFGIIPVIGARFMVHFLGLPLTVTLLGWSVPTHLLLMALFLTICAVMTTVGGQISVLLTDCAEGMFSQLFYVCIAVGLLFFFFHWPSTKAVLLDTPPGKSLVNPFDSFSLKDFNIWYVLMGIASGIYGTMAWQNSHAFNASGASPHEARMGGILGRWRAFAAGVMVTILSVCALTYLRSPEGGAVVDAALANVKDPSTASQMRVPIALSHLLPVGLKGMLVSICLMGIIAGDGIHLHSWSSLFIQDVIVPLRKEPLSIRQHLLLLRVAVVGVALFAFCFGAVFPQTEYVQIWWAVTQAIFTGGAGAAIIGGLYWSRGTTAGAWVGFLVGSVLSVGGIIARIWWQKVLGHEFPLNGVQIGFFASIAALLCYVVVSLLTCKQPHDMDRLLHRGRYAVEPEAVGEKTGETKPKVPWLYRIVGIDEHFNRMDRWITLGIFWWSMFWFFVFVVGSLVYLVHPWSNAAWATYWLVAAVWLPLLIGIATTIWFTIGCWQDMRVFFRRLREEKIDAHDDGTVYHEKPAPSSPGR